MIDARHSERRWTRRSAVYVGAMWLVACAYDAGTPTEEVTVREGVDGFTSCGKIYRETSGGVVAEDEAYSFILINQRLAANRELRQAVGMDRVASCEEARRFMRAQDRYLDESAERSGPEQAVDDGPPAAEEEEAQLTDKILNGSPTHWDGVVRLVFFLTGGLQGSCTGVILNSRALLTSAHCIPQEFIYGDWSGDGVNDGGAGEIAVNYDRPQNASSNPTIHCLTAGPGSYPGSCGGNRKRVLAVRRHPGWSGNSDTQDDLAMIFSPGGIVWPGPAGYQPVHWMGLTSDGLAEDHDFWAIGQGVNSNGGSVYFDSTIQKWADPGLNAGTLRQGNLSNIDTLGSTYLAHEGAQSRVCRGDSGGPAIEGRAYSAAGIASSFRYDSDYGSMSNPVPACAEPGFNQYFTRPSWHFTWINNAMTEWFGQVQCKRSASNRGVWYWKCGSSA